MDVIIDFFTSTDPNILLAFYVALFFLLEQIFTTPFIFKNRGSHLAGNLVLLSGYTVVGFGFGYVTALVLSWVEMNQTGLFNHLALPYWLKMLAGLFCNDFTNYWAHRAYHRLPVLWQLHRVHHSDTTLDSTTTFRFHPFDAVLDGTAVLLSIIFFGLDGTIVLLHLTLYLPLLAAHHSNFIFPEWVDRFPGRVFMVPNFHKVHHHRDQAFTDTNYGNIFVFWDKLFGTFRQQPVTAIKYGLDEFGTPERQSPGFLLLSPFIRIKSGTGDKSS